jgi:hypothetical protein
MTAVTPGANWVAAGKTGAKEVSFRPLMAQNYRQVLKAIPRQSRRKKKAAD